MVDYEITVDVSNASVATKIKVQDAFFKLGFEWWFYGTNYTNLDAYIYSNTLGIDEISGYIYCSEMRKPTHTIEQLLEMVV